MPTQPSVEVLVIGGGVIGSAMAYFVARQGRRVLVLERAAEVAAEPAASWASAGGIRRQEQDPAEAMLALEAITHWQTLSQELDADLEYRQGGHLLLAETDAEAESLVSFVRGQHDLGFADIRLLDRAAVFALAPGLGEQVVAGSFSPADGQANPVLTTRAFADAARRFGATFAMGTECLTLLREGDRVVGVRTSAGDVRAEQTVVAAGAWSRELLRSIGIELPMQTRVLQAMLSTRAETGLLRPVVNPLGRALSLKQLPDGAFLIGGGWFGDTSPADVGYTLRPKSTRRNWESACEVFPAVARQQVARVWGGLQAHSFDDLPYIGGFSGLDGLTLAFGSWHGFGLAPAIGRSVADYLAGKPAPELDKLTPGRIARFDQAEVAAFLREPETAREH